MVKGTSNNHQIMANIISTGGDDIQWRKMVLTVRRLCCGIIRERVWRFLVMEGGIGMTVAILDQPKHIIYLHPPQSVIPVLHIASHIYETTSNLTRGACIIIHTCILTSTYTYNIYISGYM